MLVNSQLKNCTVKEAISMEDQGYFIFMLFFKSLTSFRMKCVYICYSRALGNNLKDYIECICL